MAHLRRRIIARHSPLVTHLAIASDQISRVRPAGKADNKVDISYLYYLPFCHVFTSKDNLHRRVVPLFLREDQSFVDADDLKADLHKLDAHFWAMPDDIKTSGFFRFAAFPPDDQSFLTTQLWDKHAPHWRENRGKASTEVRDKESESKLIAEMKRIQDMAQSAPPIQAAPLTPEETMFVQIIHTPLRRKGKWIRYPDDV